MKSFRTSTTIATLTALAALAVLDWYMDQWVDNVSMDKTDKMAKKLLAQLNDDIDAVQATINKYYKEQSSSSKTIY